MAIPEPNDTYAKAFNIGSLTGAKTYKDVVGGTDLYDFYKFEIPKNSTVTFSLTGLSDDAEIAVASDLNKDGQYSSNEIIDYTSTSGAVDRILNSDLGTGTYYVFISPSYPFSPDGRINTKYTLQITPKAIVGVNPTKDPSFTYATAFNIGPLSAAKTYKQFVGAQDLGDFYKFSVTNNSTVTLNLTGLSDDAEIAIVSDTNKDGQYSSSEIIDYTSTSGSGDRILISDLGTGTYYALVAPSYPFGPDSRSNTNYTLKITPKAIVGVNPTKDPGFTYATAFNVGPLSAAKTYKQFVGAQDLGDFYKFSVAKNSTVTLNLTGLSDDAEIAIVSDLNKDGQYSSSEIIDYTSTSGSGDRILISDLGTGTYYALVAPSYPFSPDSRSNTNYTLKITPKAIVGVNPTKDPGFTYATAFNVGPLGTAKTYKQFVGAQDLGDFYKFSVAKNSNVTLSLTGLRDDAEIAIASDLNKDGQYSSSEIIDYTSTSGLGDRALLSNLTPGTYYALVAPSYPFSPDGRANTNYTLQLKATTSRVKAHKSPAAETRKLTPKSPQPKTTPLPPQQQSWHPLMLDRSEGHNPALHGLTAPLTVSMLPPQPPHSSKTTLQAFSPSCDVLMTGAVLLTLGARCLPAQ